MHTISFINILWINIQNQLTFILQNFLFITEIIWYYLKLFVFSKYFIFETFIITIYIYISIKCIYYDRPTHTSASTHQLNSWPGDEYRQPLRQILMCWQIITGLRNRLQWCKVLCIYSPTKSCFDYLMVRSPKKMQAFSKFEILYRFGNICNCASWLAKCFCMGLFYSMWR